MKPHDSGPSVARSVDQLKALINLPISPSEVWFEDVPRGQPGGLGPTDYVLVAVLRMAPTATAELTKTATSRPGNRISSTANRPWLPPPVRAAIQPFDDHSVTVRGQKFDAAPFLKAPFSTGYFIVVDGGEYVIVSLQTS
ncbi:MAG TPA: hypothetical protein VH374_12605 [Polyangia bacterium]|jgi:hypothetical protein|nr:hypothetical protein [Polyangia bacterium]